MSLEFLSGLIEGNPIIVYGGVKQYPQRAQKTEEFLMGKCFSDRKVIAEMNFFGDTCVFELILSWWKLLKECVWSQYAWRSC